MLNLDALQANPQPAKPLHFVLSAVTSPLIDDVGFSEDLDWEPARITNGTGNIQVRYVAGAYEFRGTLKYTMAVGPVMTVLFLPEHFPTPKTNRYDLVAGLDSGTTFRCVIVRLTTLGQVAITPLVGGVTETYLDGSRMA